MRILACSTQKVVSGKCILIEFKSFEHHVIHCCAQHIRVNTHMPLATSILAFPVSVQDVRPFLPALPASRDTTDSTAGHAAQQQLTGCCAGLNRWWHNNREFTGSCARMYRACAPQSASGMFRCCSPSPLAFARARQPLKWPYFERLYAYRSVEAHARRSTARRW